ncbi:hypothetical protein [Streptomyces sp. NPDC098101]|uniref:hypothetical protein n=1 Tax=Streptomyces sp. NPDC098101 TaxID=3366096 RepID=UPI00382B966D
MGERYGSEEPDNGVRQWARASDHGQVHQAGRDQHFWGSGPAPQATASLPPDRPLTGRKERTDTLLAALAPDGASTTVVTGLPGVGKTALALTTGLPRAVHHPAGLVRRRLGDKLPPLPAPDPRMRHLRGAGANVPWPPGPAASRSRRCGAGRPPGG